MLITGSLEDNTVKSYSLTVMKFYDFRTRFNLATNWPPALLSLSFSSHNYRQSVISVQQCSTARFYIAGLSFYIKANTLFDPTQSFVIKKMMSKGFQRLKPTIDVRAPITLEILKSFPTAMLDIASSQYEALLFSIAFSVAFFGFLRIREMVAMSRRGDT